ncbi:MAG: ParB-like protein [Xanthobacteraceae bacterium]|nr:ParB-like protein [Xanthobacteraceae bacterium]
MANKREPIVKPVPILSLKPTQLTVGMREVREKRKVWREHKPKKRAEVLGRHMIPVVVGPGGEHYVIDHHHLARALHDEGIKDVLITVVADLSLVDRALFWNAMDGHRFVHPYDAKGVRQRYDKLPKSIVGLKDDPYRSLAGELRRAGGFAKDTTPFSEFMWADFLRRRIPRKTVENNFAKAMERALSFGRSKDAIYLPGWCGPSSED